MCWWHMATRWQLGVQVQEQTWVLKSQLAEAKFSAWALGASVPGKCVANIPCYPALPSCHLQTLSAGDHHCSSDIQRDKDEKKQEDQNPVPGSQSGLNHGPHTSPCRGWLSVAWGERTLLSVPKCKGMKLFDTAKRDLKLGGTRQTLNHVR